MISKRNWFKETARLIEAQGGEPTVSLGDSLKLQMRSRHRKSVDEASIVSMCEAGSSLHAIAPAFAVSHTSVAKVLAPTGKARRAMGEANQQRWAGRAVRSGAPTPPAVMR
jgi:hypothetical protein